MTPPVGGRRDRSRGAAWAAASAAAAAVSVYVVQRGLARRWRSEEETDPSLALPADAVHHLVPVDDGGRIHVVERGRGPAVVLVHGVTLGVAVWAHQLRDLSDGHRVLAVGQRGHGRSVAGTEGYSIERLADDLLAVLESLGVERSVLVGHSLGGMVTQVLALRHAERLAARVAALGLVATSAGPVVLGPGGHHLAGAVARGAGRGLRVSERHGRGVLPQADLAAWAARAAFGSHPRPGDVAVARAMLGAMSPSAMAGLLGPILSFDVHRRLGEIRLPTGVVVGSRDLLTPPPKARQLARLIPGASLTVLPGCGHMVMLERPEALTDLVRAWATEHGSADPG